MSRRNITQAQFITLCQHDFLLAILAETTKGEKKYYNILYTLYCNIQLLSLCFNIHIDLCINTLVVTHMMDKHILW